MWDKCTPQSGRNTMPLSLLQVAISWGLPEEQRKARLGAREFLLLVLPPISCFISNSFASSFRQYKFIILDWHFVPVAATVCSTLVHSIHNQHDCPLSEPRDTPFSEALVSAPWGSPLVIPIPSLFISPSPRGDSWSYSSYSVIPTWSVFNAYCILQYPVNNNIH